MTHPSLLSLLLFHPNISSSFSPLIHITFTPSLTLFFFSFKSRALYMNAYTPLQIWHEGSFLFCFLYPFTVSSFAFFSYIYFCWLYMHVPLSHDLTPDGVHSERGGEEWTGLTGYWSGSMRKQCSKCLRPCFSIEPCQYHVPLLLKLLNNPSLLVKSLEVYI